MAVPRVQEIAQHLTMARHQSVAEDLLDSSPPSVRLTFRPWQGPLSRDGSVEGHLEITVESLHQDCVVVRSAVRDGERLVAEDQERLPTKRLTAGWLEARILTFIGLVLDLA
jgi:hypothetical protein